MTPLTPSRPYHNLRVTLVYDLCIFRLSAHLPCHWSSWRRYNLKLTCVLLPPLPCPPQQSTSNRETTLTDTVFRTLTKHNFRQVKRVDILKITHKQAEETLSNISCTPDIWTSRAVSYDIRPPDCNVITTFLPLCTFILVCQKTIPMIGGIGGVSKHFALAVIRVKCALVLIINSTKWEDKVLYVLEVFISSGAEFADDTLQIVPVKHSRMWQLDCRIMRSECDVGAVKRRVTAEGRWYPVYGNRDLVEEVNSILIWLPHI